MSRGADGKREQIVLIEVKCFPDKDSETRELYASIGQYLVYRAMINELGLPFALYLAVSESTFNELFDSAVLRVISESRIKVVVINLDREAVAKWIENR